MNNETLYRNMTDDELLNVTLDHDEPLVNELAKRLVMSNANGQDVDKLEDYINELETELKTLRAQINEAREENEDQAI